MPYNTLSLRYSDFSHVSDLYKAPVSATVVVVVDPGVVGAGVVVTQLGGVQ